METPDPMSTLPPPPPPPPFATRRLRRRPAEGKIAGVCSGLADYLGVDVTLVRLVALVLVLMGPGVIAYLAAWVVVPAARPGDPRLSPPSVTRGSGTLVERGPQFLGVVLLVIALLVVADDWDWPGERFFFPLLLIGVGAALLWRQPTVDDEPPEVAPEIPATRAPQGIDMPTPWYDEVAAEPAVMAPVRRHSKVTPMALGAAMLWAGVAVLLEIDVDRALAVGLGILGAGLVVGAIVGGGRVLALPAIAVGVALLGTATIDVPLSGGVGERTWVVGAPADAEDSPFRLAAGEALLDLRELRPGAERTVEIEATIGFGELRVELPEDVPVEIDASANAGSIVLLGDEPDDGIDVEKSIDEPSRRGVGRIVLDLEVGFGEIRVNRP